ncbi:MAG TPA: hypothetical protein VLA72_09920 [Anaerolineales bacterium]|nr:hypothetical protein [Anaerolineales bacterium]
MKHPVERPSLDARILAHLEKRFRECTNEKHFNLLRTDILTSIKSMFDEENDENYW